MNFILSYSFFTSTDAGLSVSWDVSAAKDSLVNDQNTIILVRPVGVNYWDVRTSGITGYGSIPFSFARKTYGNRRLRVFSFQRHTFRRTIRKQARTCAQLIKLNNKTF